MSVKTFNKTLIQICRNSKIQFEYTQLELIRLPKKVRKGISYELCQNLSKLAKIQRAEVLRHIELKPEDLRLYTESFLYLL